jgi:hypothetical protein
MRFFKLRIAWSMCWGVFAVLLIALWVRSNRRIDQVIFPVTQSTYIGLGSVPNAFMVGLTNVRPPETWGSGPADEWLSNLDDEDLPWSAARKFRTLEGQGIMMPYWFPVLISGTLVVIPWLPWSKRFGLRTLLIITTLVAVVLGIAAYFSARPPAAPRFDQGFGR